MSPFKKAILITAILVIAIMNVLIYWNQHLYYKAERAGDTEKRIEVLEKAANFFPLNDLVFYELGKAYHDLGVNSLGEEGRSSVHLQKSIIQFQRSLRINPTSYFGHFYLAQAYLKMSFDLPSYEEKAREEYKKAAYLAGGNTEILFEIGKFFLSQWGFLSQQDRDFAIAILERVVEGKDSERIHSLFYIWEINVEDYEVMSKIFPEYPQIYRDFAKFLGERGLSLEERLKHLARAELLEILRAQEAFERGESAFYYYRYKEAQNHFSACLDILENIHFYQDIFASQNQIDPAEFKELQKKALLSMVKSNLEQGVEFRDVEDYLWEYLEKEDDAAAIGELESYLRGKGFGREEAGTRFNDLGRLSLQLCLNLKEGRFRDNMSVGRDILRSFGVVPEGQEDQFVKILEIVAESFQRVDFIYDSNDFYYKALEWDPDNLKILLKLRGNYERLSAYEKIQQINRKIQEVVSPREIDVSRSINKGQMLSQNMVLDGREINLGIHFEESEGGREPLITILINGRVIWEDYLKEDKISVQVRPKVGGNLLQVVPVDLAVKVMKITLSDLL